MNENNTERPIEYKIALVWHPYPAEKPHKRKRYAVIAPVDPLDGGLTLDVRYWGGDQFYEYDHDIVYWAEIPLPVKGA